LTIDDIGKFTKDDKMKYLVVEYTNGCFYGFNLVVKNERQTATNTKNYYHGLYHIRNGKVSSVLVKVIMLGKLKLLL
jgi:hypothetical protein